MRTRTQGKGAVTPTDLARLACECLKVLCGGVGQQWTATWTGALAAAVLESLCHISPFEGQLQPYHRAWAASGQTTNREGAQLHPSVENWIKDLQNMALLTTPRFDFTHSQSLPSGSLHKRLILIHQRADRSSKNYNPMAPRMKTTITEN